MTVRHICPKNNHNLIKPQLIVMQPINGYKFDDIELPIYHVIGSSITRPYKCPICKLVEFYEETPEGNHYLIGEVGHRGALRNV